jgi:hypothetical protein
VNPAIAPEAAGRPAVRVVSSGRTVKKARGSMPDDGLRDKKSSSKTSKE